MRLKALVFAALPGQVVVHDGNNGAAQQTHQNSGEHGEDDIGRIVDVQVQPGVGHQERNDGGGDAGPFVLNHQHRGGLEAADGVAGGEGAVQVTGEKPLDVAFRQGHPALQLG